MYLRNPVTIAVTYDGSEGFFYVNGGLANREPLNLNLHCNGELDIGWYSTT